MAPRYGDQPRPEPARPEPACAEHACAEPAWRESGRPEDACAAGACAEHVCRGGARPQHVWAERAYSAELWAEELAGLIEAGVFEVPDDPEAPDGPRSEEHTSELQSPI